MRFRQMHLDKGGNGMAFKTACGRNIMRAPLSANWEDFKKEKPENQCAKCAASKQALINAKADEKKVDQLLIPEDDENSWIARDAALVAAHKAKRQAT